MHIFACKMYRLSKREAAALGLISISDTNLIGADKCRDPAFGQ